MKNVHETLSIMGYSSTKRQFFRRLKNRIRESNTGGRENSSASSSSETSSDGSGPEPDDSAMSDDQDREDHLDPTKRRALPSGLIPQSDFHHIWSFMGDFGDGTQVLGDMDEDAVMKELAAEDAVDKLDRDADRELEDSLWEEIGVQRYIQPEVVEAEPEPPVANVPAAKPRGAKSIRFRKPGGTIKSQVFIEDSDEDGWGSPEP